MLLPFNCARNHVRNDETYLAVFAVNDVLLSVQEPVWDFVLPRVGHDGDNFFYLLFGTFSCAFVQVYVGLFQDYVGIAPAHSFDRRQGKHYLPLAIDVRTEDTKDVLELLWDY